MHPAALSLFSCLCKAVVASAMDATSLSRAWSFLGWRRVDVFASFSLSARDMSNVVVAASATNVAVSFVHDAVRNDSKFLLIHDDLDVLADVLSSGKIAADSLMFSTSYSLFHVGDSLNGHCSTSFFVLMLSSFSLLHATCLRNGSSVVLNEWPQDVGFYKEMFDLHGEELALVSLDWEPEVLSGSKQNITVQQIVLIKIDVTTVYCTTH